MSDSVIITFIICLTIAVLGIVGSFGNKKVGDLKGTISRYTNQIKQKRNKLSSWKHL